MRSYLAILLLSAAAFAQDIPEYSFGDVLGKAAVLTEREKEIRPLNQKDFPTDAAISDDNYILGPGDVLSLSFGSSRTITVSPEGILNLSGFSPVAVSGKTLAEAKTSIKKLVSKSYDTSKVFISLSQPNEYKVWVVGEVLSPGPKKSNSFVRLTDALELAKGFSPYAVRGKIRIKHLDGSQSTADLAEFYRTHDFSLNPTLRFGDIVTVERIDFSKPYVVVRNDNVVLFQGLEDKPSLSDIFLQASGYAKTKDPSHVDVIGKNGVATRITPEQTFVFTPSNGDTINFSTKKAAVFVGGSVMRPGSYEYIPGLTPLDYAYLAGITGEAGAYRGYRVIRQEKDYTSRTFKDGVVQPGDKVYMERRWLSLARDYGIVLSAIVSVVASSTTLYVVMNQ